MRTILILGLSKADIESNFIEHLMQSLAVFPGEQLFLNATGEEKKIEGYEVLSLPESVEQIYAYQEEKHYLVNIDNDSSPFEKQAPEFWQAFTQKSLLHRKTIIIAAPPALIHSDWEEWLSTVHAFILLRMGGQSMIEKDKEVIRAIYSHKKSFQATVFIEKEQ